MSKLLFIVTVEEKSHYDDYINGESVRQLSLRAYEEFVYADSEQDALDTWKRERQKQIDEDLHDAFKHYKGDFKTWCTNYGWNVQNQYIDCKFYNNTKQYRRYKHCPWCKAKTLHHQNIEAERKKTLKFHMDNKKPVRVRLFRAIKSRSVGIYKWPKRI